MKIFFESSGIKKNLKSDFIMASTTEAHARIKINNMLTDAGWRLINGENGRANVDLEYSTKIQREDRFNAGLLDYLLHDKLIKTL